MSKASYSVVASVTQQSIGPSLAAPMIRPTVRIYNHA